MIDIHTHHSGMGRAAIYSLTPVRGFLPDAAGYYSLGIHPWYVKEFLRGEFCSYEELESLWRLPEILAIGEAGLDKLFLSSFSHSSSSPLSPPEAKEAWQQSLHVFEWQVQMSETIGKPLIIHCVRAVDELLAIRRTVRPRQQWIVHGFRGKPEQAEQLLNQGIALSLGEKFNPETATLIPAEQLFLETDESTCSIYDILSNVSLVRQESEEALSAQLQKNTGRTFSI